MIRSVTVSVDSGCMKYCVRGWCMEEVCTYPAQSLLRRSDCVVRETRRHLREGVCVLEEEEEEEEEVCVSVSGYERQ